MAGGAASEFSRGGMRTKIEAAKIAHDGGVHMVIADGRVEHPLRRIDEGAQLHLVPDAVEPGHVAKEMDRRLAGAAGAIVRIDAGAAQRASSAARACCRRASPASRAVSRAAIAS